VLYFVILCGSMIYNLTTKVLKGHHKDFYDKTNRSLKIFSDWYSYPRFITAHNL